MPVLDIVFLWFRKNRFMCFEAGPGLMTGPLLKSSIFGEDVLTFSSSWIHCVGVINSTGVIAGESFRLEDRICYLYTVRGIA